MHLHLSSQGAWQGLPAAAATVRVSALSEWLTLWQSCSRAASGDITALQEDARAQAGGGPHTQPSPLLTLLLILTLTLLTNPNPNPTTPTLTLWPHPHPGYAGHVPGTSGWR